MASTNTASVVVCAGNSLTFGNSLDAAATSYPAILGTILGPNAVVRNSGVGGQTTAQILAAFQPQVGQYYDPTKANLLVIWEGTNSLYFGATAATTIAQMESIAQQWKALDPANRAYVGTLMPRGDFPGTSTIPGANAAAQAATFDAERLALNSLIAASLHFDKVVDIAADPRLGAAGAEFNATYFDGSGVHLNSAGYPIVARHVADAIGPGPSTATAGNPGRPFVRRVGNKLYSGGVPLGPLAATNCCGPGLDRVSSWVVTSDNVYPSRRRVDDWYAQATAMGCQVVRLYACMPSLGSPMTCWPNQASATSLTPNEAAYEAIDLAVARAAAHGLRLVIPLCDAYAYYVGSMAQWSGYFGGNGTDFFANPAVIKGFLACVGYHVTRKNSITGLRYCDDPTVMCWETGNELQSLDSWTATVAAYLKAVAPNQLVMDGKFNYQTAQQNPVRFTPAQLACPDTDMVSNHDYPMDDATTVASVTAVQGSDKVFVLPEYDWNNNRGGDTLTSFLALVDADREMIGLFGFWNIASHADTYGWAASANNYVGQDGLPYDTLLGANTPNQAKILQLRDNNYVYRGLPRPAWPAPGITRAFAVGQALAWTGAAGAASYTVERSVVSASAGFAAVASGLDDHSTPWTDPDKPSSPVWYRVRGVAPDGATGQPSTTVEF